MLSLILSNSFYNDAIVLV